MKKQITRILLPIAFLGLLHATGSAALLMTMTFDSVGNIDESAGWDGTTAPGGFISTGLTVSSGMAIYGGFTPHTKTNAFVAHNWQPTNSGTSGVDLTVSADPGYTFSLGGGSETFSTRLHHTPEPQNDLFDRVELYINNISMGTQSYTPALGAQTLIWNIGANNSLNNLTSATFDLKFLGSNTPPSANHGPQWELSDSAFVSFTGSVIPEPSQAIMACIGMGLMLIRRRR